MQSLALHSTQKVNHRREGDGGGAGVGINTQNKVHLKSAIAWTPRGYN